jgi:hypothetical protein
VWSELLGVGTNQENALAMASPTAGFAAIENPRTQQAIALRTSDGGATWHPQVIASGGTALANLVSSDSGRAYALVHTNFAPFRHRFLLYTANGGDAGSSSAIALRGPAKPLTAGQLRARKGKVIVHGTLSGALGGEQVTVAQRSLTGKDWDFQTATAGANGGGFTTDWTITRSSIFVAQWAGDSGRAGAGSAVLRVTVAPTPKPKRRN